ncbi:26S proteasome regulatory complex, non-ATPase subcomplex, Rpn2/Psmd1 subunit [Neoconidiobolus thromboides FSU 785]|nr:26S proteasome regulatory complex, non-ATPase subcomplex, Rpn2/Psmd1 subunit [Neoconidiobolus thromboides FSU 785]
MSIQTSASGLISLLEENEIELKVYALNQLNGIIDQFWTEIAESVAKIEVLYEDESFQSRELAALVASKVYYFLGELDDSLTFALGAGTQFNPDEKNEYVQTILSKAIDRYIEVNKSSQERDSRLLDLVERMFEKCLQDKEYKQAIGIALESHRLDIVERAIKEGETAQLLEYILNISLKLVEDKEFRIQTINLVKNSYQNLAQPDYLAVAQCYIYLDDVKGCYDLIQHLMSTSEDIKYLFALQIAFDVESSATQNFKKQLADQFSSVQTDDMEDNNNKFKQLVTILNGQLPTELRIKFLSTSNAADLAILKSTRTCLDSRNSLYHSAVSFANAFMNAGTTCDNFLRQNLEWLSRASNWSKFSATAGLGVMHKGNIKNWKSVLAPYLPNETAPGSPYSEGGSLFAMGLIHSNHFTKDLEYILNIMKTSQDEIIQHGAALGLGVSAMGTDNEEFYGELKKILFTDSAVAGEAAGVAMGLVKLGTGSESAVEEMLRYAQETQHEKIIRGIAIGIALIMYGSEDKAEVLIEKLMGDQDHIIRYGGMYTIGLAYCGTNSNVAIKKLLHVAVSDVNDDVRKAAVTCLGFIMFKDPSKVPRAVQLLSESYNPHVRYGATLALGIACAGTGLMEAIEILEPMTKDSSDFVRQGALIALSMILCQHNESSNTRTASVRKLLEATVADKHESAMTKFGAAIGQGLIDAGGRNCRISLQNQMGLTDSAAVAGMAIFTQFWYWFPFTHFVSLCFMPTTFIGVNSEIKAPKFDFVSRARPSLFAYPSKAKVAQQESVTEKVPSAVLSTAKYKSRNKKKRENVEESEVKENELEEKEKINVIEEEKEIEAEFDSVGNMQRVLPSQAKYLFFPVDGRYFPIKQKNCTGIVVLNDVHQSDSEEEEFLYPDEEDEDKSSPTDVVDNTNTNTQNTTATTSNSNNNNNNNEPPKPFEFQFD